MCNLGPRAVGAQTAHRMYNVSNCCYAIYQCRAAGHTMLKYHYRKYAYAKIRPIMIHATIIQIPSMVQNA